MCHIFALIFFAPKSPTAQKITRVWKWEVARFSMGYPRLKKTTPGVS